MILFTGYSVTGQVPERIGWWRFDDPIDMLKASIGQALQLEGSQESIDGPAIGNLATQIGVGSYLRMIHNIGANGGGERTNEYTLQIDFSIPEADIWHSFLQISPDNPAGNDGDLFINTSLHIGVWEAAYSDTTIELYTWYRMVLTVLNGNFFRIYLNGTLIVDAPGRDIDSRYGIGDTLLIFADNDGEDGEIWCSELGIWDVALSVDEVTALGDATNSPTGIMNRQPAVKEAYFGQNYPNPFRYSTSFPYQVNRSGNVSFRLMDVTGKLIQTTNEGIKTPGNYTFKFNAEKLKPGMYYMQMVNDDQTIIRKIIIN